MEGHDIQELAVTAKDSVIVRGGYPAPYSSPNGGEYFHEYFAALYNELNVVSFDERFTWINAKDGSFPILDIYEIRNVDEYHVLFICRLSVYMSFTCEKFYFEVTDIYTCRKLFRYYSFLFTSFINTYTSCFNPETKSAFSSTFRTGYAPKIQEALSLSFEMNIQRAFCDSNLANFLCIVSLRRRK